jgi:hypothetical protein
VEHIIALRGFQEIEEVPSEERLSEHCVKKIRKVRGIVTDMIATIAFLFGSSGSRQMPSHVRQK